MTQRTAAKYDYCSWEVRASPSLVLNIKAKIKTVQINREIYIEKCIVSAKAASLVAELALGALASAFSELILQWSNLAYSYRAILGFLHCCLSGVYFVNRWISMQSELWTFYWLNWFIEKMAWEMSREKFKLPWAKRLRNRVEIQQIRISWERMRQYPI